MPSRERKADGAKIKRLRENMWLSQRELAEQTDLTVQTISRIETGEHPYPQKRSVFAIAQVLGVSPSDLLEPENREGSSDPLPLPNGSSQDHPEPGQTRRTG